MPERFPRSFWPACISGNPGFFLANNHAGKILARVALATNFSRPKGEDEKLERHTTAGKELAVESVIRTNKLTRICAAAKLQRKNI